MKLINILFDIDQLKLPIDDLIGLRIQASLELLAGGELNITEIAARCGFSDSHYFARQFRRRMGLSSREFRAQRSPDPARRTVPKH